MNNLKLLAKKIVLLFSKIIVFPLVLLYKLFSLHKPNYTIFCTIGQLLAIFPGKIGGWLRVAFYSTVLPEVSPQIHIDFGTFFAHPDVVVGEGVYIGAYCIIGKCVIGAQTLIGSFVNILSGSHQHSFVDLKQNISSQGGEFTRINVGKGSWIGNNSVLMTDIGERCIIGAGSVVVKTIPPYSVAVGNPCRVIKKQNS